MSEQDPSVFVTHSSDKRGHNVSVKFAVPPEMAERVAALVAQGHFPQYRTQADFWRDAGYHRLAYLADYLGDEECERALERVKVRHRIEEVKAIEDFWSQTVDDLRDMGSHQQMVLDEIAHLRTLDPPEWALLRLDRLAERLAQ